MFDVAAAAVEGALAAGARYADARGMILRYESMSAKNGDVEDLVQSESVGLGVRT
jgi:TldD protein